MRRSKRIDNCILSWFFAPYCLLMNHMKNMQRKKGTRSKFILQSYYTLISPAKQCASMPSGTSPLFNWSLTYSSWLFSALILKMPSACMCKFNNSSNHNHALCSASWEEFETEKTESERYWLKPAILLQRRGVFALVIELLAHCSLWSQMITAWIPLKLQKQLHCMWKFIKIRVFQDWRIGKSRLSIKGYNLVKSQIKIGSKSDL